MKAAQAKTFKRDCGLMIMIKHCHTELSFGDYRACNPFSSVHLYFTLMTAVIDTYIESDVIDSEMHDCISEASSMKTFMSMYGQWNLSYG